MGNLNLETTAKFFRKATGFLFSLVKRLCWIIIYSTFILGAVCSFILLQKLYPGIFNIIMTPFLLIISKLFLVTIFLIRLLLAFAGLYVGFIFIRAMKKLGCREKKRREKKREDFLNELAIKIKKKMKEKKNG